METQDKKEQRIRVKFQKLIETAPEFADFTKQKKAKMLRLLCDWFKINQRLISPTEFAEMRKECLRNRPCEVCGKESEDDSGFCKTCWNKPQVQKALFRVSIV